MSNIAITSITNANIYINAFSQLGRAGELKLPDVTASEAERKSLGMFGKISTATGLEELEGEIKWDSLYPETVLLAGNPFAFHSIQARSSAEEWNHEGRASEVPVAVHMRARFVNLPLGELKSGENIDGLVTKYKATSLKLIVNHITLVEIDVLQNIWKVGGVDLLAQYRKNIGG